MVRKSEAASLLKLGDSALIMGYGKTDPKTNSTGTKMQGFSTLKLIGSSELWMDKKNGSQKCFGDSGGPTLMKSYANGAAEWHVVGVASRTGQDCTYGSVETRVDVFLDWIHKYGSIPCGSGNSKSCGGTKPKLDKGTTKKDGGVKTGKALGAACSAGYECKTKLCIHTSGKNICSQYCDISKNNCPGKWVCRPLAGSAKGACLKPDPTTPDPDAAIPPKKKVFGESCLYNADCNTGICGSAGTYRFCTKLCTPGNQDCGDKMECIPAGGGKSACSPKADPNPVDPPEDEGCTVAGHDAGGGLTLLLLLCLAFRRGRS